MCEWVRVRLPHLRCHVLGRATRGFAARPKILRFAVPEVAQLDDGQGGAAPAIDQHVVQLRGNKRQLLSARDDIICIAATSCDYTI